MELILIGVLILLNALSSAYCFTRDYSELSQKIGQILVVWLVPVVGAIGFMVFHWSESHPKDSLKPIGGGSNDSIGSFNGHRTNNSGGFSD